MFAKNTDEIEADLQKPCQISELHSATMYLTKRIQVNMLWQHCECREKTNTHKLLPHQSEYSLDCSLFGSSLCSLFDRISPWMVFVSWCSTKPMQRMKVRFAIWCNCFCWLRLLKARLVLKFTWPSFCLIHISLFCNLPFGLSIIYFFLSDSETQFSCCLFSFQND